MKENKKTLQLDLKKDLKHGDKLEKLVVDFALRKTAGSREDLDGVYYSKNGRHVLMASKSLSGKYAVCEGVREIDADSFWGCAYLEGIELPEGVEKIGHEAFGKCISLREITIPATVTEMGTNPFIGIHDMNVKSLSPEIVCDGKAVYSHKGKLLVAFISDDAEYSVPEGVECIGEKAFSGNRFIRRVVLPESLRVIDDEAFFDCSSLSCVSLPEKTENIGYCAFADCMNLKDVVFCGTPQKLKRSMLSGCDNIRTITIPQGSADKFKKLAKDYDDRIVEKARKSPMYK